jgi:thiol-disulfide isomerase/thioredoxin
MQQAKRLSLIFALCFSFITFHTAESKLNHHSRQEASPFQLRDLNGKDVSLSDFTGKVIVLNFWATWSAPSLREMPELEKLKQTFAEGNVQVLGIAVVSRSEEIPKQVKATGVTYPVLLGDKQIIADYGYFTSIPMTFIIDRQGTVVKALEGAVDYAALEREIQAALSD